MTICIEQTCCGYELTINDMFIKTYKSIEEMNEYLSSRIRSDFH